MTPTFDPTEREDRREEAARDARLHEMLDHLVETAVFRPKGSSRDSIWLDDGTDVIVEGIVRFWQEHRR